MRTRNSNNIPSDIEAQVNELENVLLEFLGFLPNATVNGTLRYETQSLFPASAYTSDIALRCFYRLNDSACLDKFPEFMRVCVGRLRTCINHKSFPHIVEIMYPNEQLQREHRFSPNRIVYMTREAPFAMSLKCLEIQNEIRFLHCEDSFAVIDKPYGLLTVDGNTQGQRSLQSRLQSLYGCVWIVHRLDQETSGLLLVAWMRMAAQNICAQFRARTINKRYHAILYGHLKSDCGSICSQLESDPENKIVQRVAEPIYIGEIDTPCALHSANDKRLAKTDWRVLHRSEDTRGKFTYVELIPITGKTHQLRVHMDYMGHAILGDSIYASNLVSKLSSRLLLHAVSIELRHPVTKEMLSFVSPCPFAS